MTLLASALSVHAVRWKPDFFLTLKLLVSDVNVSKEETVNVNSLLDQLKCPDPKPLLLIVIKFFWSSIFIVIDCGKSGILE